MDYTTQMEEAIYNKWSEFDNSDEDYSEIIDFLNSKDFRSFGDGLSAVILPKANVGENVEQ